MKNLHKFFQDGPLTIESEEEMRGLGRRLAAELERGDALGLVGDLGAGKTRLAQGVLEGLGAAQPGLSPTFSLVHEHADARIPTAHFDFYRMSTPEEALGLGWDEYLSGQWALLVEWADRFDGALMPQDAIWLTIERTGDSTRRVHCASGVQDASLAEE